MKPPVASRIHPIKYGPTKPTTLPIELTSAMPPAAAVPRNSAVGIAQNGPSVPQMPNAAIEIVVNAIAGVAGASTVRTKPAAPIKQGPATCQRRSRMRSDRARERRWHVAGSCLIGAAGFVLTVLAPATPAVALTTISIAAFGIWGTLGPFWAIPTAMLRGTAAAGGIALVNSIGNVGGFVGPYLMGWIRVAAGGSFNAGLLTLAAILVLGAVIVLRLEQPDERVV